MTKKLPNHQRRRLQSQGRCFKCNKKGHKASGCTRDPAASLAELPVELLDQICEHIIFPNGHRIIPHLFEMLDLRLTCRKINAKTFDRFASHGFATTLVRNSFEGFQRLVDISHVPALASRIRKLGLTHHEGMEIGDYEELCAKLEAPPDELSRRERRKCEARLRQTERKSNNLTFFESSTYDGIMLADALSKLPNLEKVFLMPPAAVGSPMKRASVRRAHGSAYPSASHTFSMLLACFKHSGVLPRKLVCSWTGGTYEDLVDIQALAAPHAVLKQLRNLTSLKLRLQCKASEYKNEATWASHLSTFLHHTPLLTHLEMGLEDKVGGTSAVFDRVAADVRLSHLSDLTLDSFECGGNSLPRFLRNHSQITRLTLANLNITAETTFQDVIHTLENELKSLTHVSFRQIAQANRRTVFATLGDVEASDPFAFLLEEDEEDEYDFFPDFVRVEGPFRHQATIEEWEVIRQRLNMLREDVQVLNRTYLPRHKLEESSWIDRDDDYFGF